MVSQKYKNLDAYEYALHCFRKILNKCLACILYKELNIDTIVSDKEVFANTKIYYQPIGWKNLIYSFEFINFLLCIRGSHVTLNKTSNIFRANKKVVNSYSWQEDVINFCYFAGREKYIATHRHRDIYTTS